jgi:hypothetical protein
VKRREFVRLLGGAAAWPIAAHAQQTAMPVIGVLYGVSAVERTEHYMAAFRRGLAEIGFVEGRNVAIEYRWAEGQYDRMAWMAVDLNRSPRRSHVDRRQHDRRPGDDSGDPVHSDRLYHRHRPCCGWPCRQPQPARRQCNRADGFQ